MTGCRTVARRQSYKRAGLVVYVAIVLAALPSRPPPHAQTVAPATKVGELTFPGKIIGEEDISGIALNGRFLVLVTDEGQEIQVLEKEGENSFRAQRKRVTRLIDWPEDSELDLEGVAWGDKFVYAIGSHSQKRKAVDAGRRKAGKNRERLFETAVEPSREYIFRFKITDDGTVDNDTLKHVSLRDVLANHPILRRFQVIPSKENGIDIEGIAAGKNGQVHIGFRGPVLRGGYVPILNAELKDDDGVLEAKIRPSKGLRFVNLGGRGIRDIARLPKGSGDPRFLILAGPMGDGPASYVVYEWDGEDGVPGTDQPGAHSHAMALCEIPAARRPDGGPAKAEGIAVRDVSQDSVEFIIVYDSAKKGAPTVFKCPRG